MTPLEAEFHTRKFLDRWQPWMVIAYVGITLALVGLYVSLSRVSSEQAKTKSNNTTQVAACYAQRKSGPGVVALLNLIDTLAVNTLKSSRQALIADPTSPLTKTREQSIERITKAREKTKDFVTAAKNNIPTEASCDALAKRYGVNPTLLKKAGT